MNAVAGMGYVFTSDDLKARALRPVVRALLRLALDGRGARPIRRIRTMWPCSRRPGQSGARAVDPGSGSTEKLLPASAGGDGAPLRVLLALCGDKGCLAEYVAAARRLRKQGRDIEFLLAGDPDPGNPAAVPDDTLQGWWPKGCCAGSAMWMTCPHCLLRWMWWCCRATAKAS